MALTKEQKKNLVLEVEKEIKGSTGLFFFDFGKVGVLDLSRIRILVRSLNSKVKVVQKRLLALALKNSHIEFDPNQFESQVGTIFIKGELFNFASSIYKFFKLASKSPEALGAYDIVGKTFVNKSQFKVMALLPSREVLLTQLVYVLGSPIRSFACVLEGRSKKLEAEVRG
jgi:large subunit ribosomal protein L10